MTFQKGNPVFILEDELGNTYDACKEGACNCKP